jgi:uncharacterized protein YdhG (YjbR/CyaY superfamily)
MQSTAETVSEYIGSLPSDQASVISGLRSIVLASLPQGYVESMAWGMICYEVPLSTLPDTYNKQPLVYVGIAAQKRYFSLYLMNIYQDADALELLKAAYAVSGKRLDMGKSCIRFKKLENLDLESIKRIIGMTPMEAFVQAYRKVKQS